VNSGKINPFKPEEKTKAKEESKKSDESIKDKVVKLIDLEGFKDFDFAKEVTISEVEKTEDENGYCICGKTSIPSLHLKDVKVFAKQHPSVYGYKVYMVGFFMTSDYGVTQLYSSPTGPTKDLLDMLKFADGALIYTSADVVLQMDSLPPAMKAEFGNILGDSGYKSMRLSEGRNLFGNIVLGDAGAGKHLKKLLPESEKRLLIQGRLSKNKDEIFLRGLLPPFRPSFFPKDCKQVEPSIEFTGKPSVAVKMTMGLTLPEKQEMAAKVSFEVPLGPKGAIQLALALDGTWKNPFNITGLNVGNLVVSGKITIPEMAPTFGLAGDFRIGQKIVRVAANIPVTINLSSIGLLGAINNLGTKDLLMLFKDMGGPIEKIPFPEDAIGLNDVNVSFSAKADPVLKIPEGVSVKGQLFIKSTEVAHIDAVVSKARGIIMTGSAKKLELGPLVISGDGKDKKAGTDDDGAIIDIVFPYSKDSHAYISGMAELFGISREIMVLMDRRGMGFSFTDKIFNSWKSKVEVKGEVSKAHPDFQVKVVVESDLAKDMKDAVDKVTRGKTPGFVKKIFKNMFYLRSAGFDGSLNKTIKGDIPSFWIEFAALGKKFDKKFSANLSKPAEAVKDLAKETAKTVISRIKDFVKEYLKAIKDFFVKLFGGKNGNIKDLIKKYKDKDKNRKDPKYSDLAEKYGKYFKN